MSERAVMVACFVFAGALLLMIVITLSMYRIGYNNGYDTGYRDGRSDRRKERYSNKPENNNFYKRGYADSVRVLPSRSERPVYIDGRSKYGVNPPNQNNNYR